MNLKKIALAFLALTLLAGCSGKAKKHMENCSEYVADFEKNGDRVFFGLNSVTLCDNSKSTLKAQAKWLNEHKNVSVTVEGHCDERGTREYNIALGERRANAVKSYLVKQGVDAGRIETISYGKERPAAIGYNEAAWAQNRRSVTALR